MPRRTSLESSLLHPPDYREGDMLSWKPALHALGQRLANPVDSCCVPHPPPVLVETLSQTCGFSLRCRRCSNSSATRPLRRSHPEMADQKFLRDTLVFCRDQRRLLTTAFDEAKERPRAAEAEVVRYFSRKQDSGAGQRGREMK